MNEIRSLSLKEIFVIICIIVVIILVIFVFFIEITKNNKIKISTDNFLFVKEELIKDSKKCTNKEEKWMFGGSCTQSPTKEIIADYFSHLLNGEINIWDVPGICGLNILLKDSLGGGGMSSLRIDPQGKAYAQQLLEIPIPIKKEILDQEEKK